jgi:hypothetical protein
VTTYKGDLKPQREYKEEKEEKEKKRIFLLRRIMLSFVYTRTNVAG